MYKLGGGGLLVREPPPSTWQATHLAIFACRPRSGQLLVHGVLATGDLEQVAARLQTREHVLVGLADHFGFGQQAVVAVGQLDPHRSQVLLRRDVQAGVVEGVLHAELHGLVDAFGRRGGDFQRGRAQRVVGFDVAEHHDLAYRAHRLDQLLHAVGDVVGDDRIHGAEAGVDRGVDLAHADTVHVVVGDLLIDGGVGDVGDDEVASETGGSGRNQCSHDERGEGVLLHIAVLPLLTLSAIDSLGTMLSGSE